MIVKEQNLPSRRRVKINKDMRFTPSPIVSSHFNDRNVENIIIVYLVNQFTAARKSKNSTSHFELAVKSESLPSLAGVCSSSLWALKSKIKFCILDCRVLWFIFEQRRLHYQSRRVFISCHNFTQPKQIKFWATALILFSISL